MSHRRLSSAFIGTAALALACCTSPAQAPAADAAPASVIDLAPVADSAVFTETSVWMAADGSTRVETRQVTAGEQRARSAARERAAHDGPMPEIARDTACGETSFWLFDRPDWTGNEICFIGAGSVTLHTLGFIRPVCGPIGCYENTWALQTGSYWAGSSGGGLVAPLHLRMLHTQPDASVPDNIGFGAWDKQAFDAGTLYVDQLTLAQ